MAGGPWQRLNSRQRDIALAAALAAFVQAELWTYNSQMGIARIPVAFLLLAGCASIAWRRSEPFVPASAVASVLCLQLAITRVDMNSFGWFLVISITLYSLGAYCEIRPALVGFMVMNLGLAVREIGDFHHDLHHLGELAFWELLGIVWFFVGLYVRSRRRSSALRLAAENAEVASSSSSRYAVAEERARIAHELHDVVAQDVSAVVLQAEAADALLDERPDLARESLRKIQRSSREALEEMRRVLGALNAEREEDRLVPQPTLSEVAALVARQQTIGMPAELTVIGSPRPLPPGLEVSAYRVVQEALTNVRKHAPGVSARVSLCFTDHAMTVEVSNPVISDTQSPSESGHGLIGMRERVRFFGGDFYAGQVADSFVVRASFPTPAVTAR